jgi:hypothetical protein
VLPGKCSSVSLSYTPYELSRRTHGPYNFPLRIYTGLNTEEQQNAYPLRSLQILIIIIISGSTVLARTLAASHRRFRNLIKTLGGTSDQPVAKASTYTGQSNTETQRNIHASSGIRTHDPSNEAAKTYALDRRPPGQAFKYIRSTKIKGKTIVNIYIL